MERALRIDATSFHTDRSKKQSKCLNRGNLFLFSIPHMVPVSTPGMTTEHKARSKL